MGPYRSRAGLAARVVLLVAAVSISATGMLLTVAVVDAGPRNIARESVDPGAVACGRVGSYESAYPDYEPAPGCRSTDATYD